MLTLVFVLNIFKYGLSGVLLFLDAIVYYVVSLSFSLFESLAGATIFTQEDYQGIATKFYVIIGVVMLFFLTYMLLKSLINPDDLNKNVGKIAGNFFVSIVLLGLVPLIFSYAFQIQNAIISDNIIGNLVLNNSNDNNSSLSKQGNSATLSILQAFLNNDGHDFSGGKVDGEDYYWSNFVEDVNDGHSSAFWHITAFAEPVHKGDVSYLPVFSTICGVFLLYVLISFSLDLGVRVVKLAFYEIIAPIPILLRVMPEKKSVFDNWVKACVATFIEVFIRLFVIFIVVFLANKILSKGFSGIFSNEVGMLGNVIIVLGMFAFAKQAPKLLGDVMGIDSGNIKLGIGGKLKASGFLGNAIYNTGQRTLGAVTGSAGAFWSKAVNSGKFSSLRNKISNSMKPLASSTIAGSFLYGGINGWRGKGHQFNNQRQLYYSDIIGGKGHAGLFGGRKFMDVRMEKVEKNLKDSLEKEAKTEIANAEGSQSFQRTYQEIFANQNSANAEKLDELYERQRKEKRNFEEKKKEELKKLEDRIEELKNILKTQTDKKMSNLKTQFDAAARNGNYEKMTQLQHEMDSLSKSGYDSSELRDLMNKRSQKLSENYQNIELEAEIKKYSSIDEASILEETRKKFAKENERYKANRDYVRNREIERYVKEYREQHAEDAAVQESMLKNAFKDLKGVPGGLGPKPLDKPKSDLDKK